ncbi:Phytoene dehydrogenase-related protein [Paraoerskovia marina]|uniref:Phytoene dehydrogenase-related protein n=1 Tax=Paraoerskovia marina TaxID=545619 RepID=A0A1H1Q2U9_9CELL|nr:NAD(P)/FAD-dependent oxidoreductase [Paraoerskovia marina]SDS17812.1 Phytoene dehydrogenase-related protein [Paraoerskovia marina]
MHDVVVVGSGPNGLAAAVTTARAGLDVLVLEAQPTVGGGARTLRDDHGLLHDVCSAVHPLAWASPFFREFDLAARGVELLVPDVSYAHPLPDGAAALAYRDLATTAASLGQDGDRWAATFGPLARDWEALVGALLGRSVRPTPAALRGAALAARYALGPVGARGVRSGPTDPFRAPEAQALFAGVAAHTSTRLPGLAAGGTGALLGALAHAPGGWPVPRSGSQAIVDALVADLTAHGGRVEVDRPVRSRRDLPPARGYVLDTSPEAAREILGGTRDVADPGERASGVSVAGAGARGRGLVRGWGAGAGARMSAAARVDLVLDGPVPWEAPDVGRAGTVHLGGHRAEIVRAEAEVAAGRHAVRPVVLVSDPAVVDPTREVAGLRPLWTYAHVPLGSDRDVTDDVLAQLERFAPGVRDRVVDTRCTPAARMAEHDANLVGGNISGGPVTVPRVLLGPRLRRSPWDTGHADAVLGSASTPPGPGVHGMGGWFAARRLLRGLGLSTPSLAP